MVALTDQAVPNGNGAHDDEDVQPPSNPHPGRVILSRQYIAEEHINRQLLLNYPDPTKEISQRFEGIDIIDTLVNNMQMPLKTFSAACTFFHKLRLNHSVKDSTPHDIAVACLFVACKSEDTLKKSRDVLCASYNLRFPNEFRTPDDKIFDKASQNIIALERQILESIAFDFRVRYPQGAVIKLLKKVLTKEEADYIYSVAWDMAFDMYKTYMPLKNTTFGMGYAIVELSSRLTGEHVEKLKVLDPSRQKVPRMRIRQGLVDLLELYTQHHKQTKLGARFDLDQFLQIKIEVNKEIEEAGPNALPRCPWPLPTNEDLHAIPAPASGQLTNRFVFDVDEARREQAIVQQHFEDEWEEVEVEVEEEIPEPAPSRPRDRRGHGGHGGPGGRGGYRGGHGHPDHHGRDNWRGRRNDRHRRGY